MPAAQLDDIMSPGVDVLGTSQSGGGAILAQTGDVVAQQTDCEGVEVWGPVGYLGRPAKAVPGSTACQAVTLNQGSNDLAIAFRDQRANIPIGEGEVVIFAPGADGKGTTRILLQDGMVTVTAGAVSLAGGADFAALSAKVDANFAKIVSLFGGWTPTPQDGGAALKAAAAGLSFDSVAASKVKIT